MLLLVTILLVLIATVTLLIGIFGDNLALIFISIGASAAAAIVLAVLSQVSKRKSPGATPAVQDSPAADEPTAVGGRPTGQAAASIAGAGEPVAARRDAPTTTMPTVSTGGVPIAGYDQLRVNEIIPALEGLDLDQLEAVAQYEESNKNRTTVLNRVDDLMDQLEAEESGVPSAPAVSEDTAAAIEAIEEVGEPVGAPSAPDDDEEDFPIAGFDDLDEDELIALLEDLDADELEVVADREEAGQNRDAVLDAIDDRLDVLEGIVPAPAPARSVKPSAKAPVKTAAKAPTKVAPSRKVAAGKVPAKKVPAKKVPARKASAQKAPARASAPAGRKAPARKASAPTPARKAPARASAARTPARKAAAPARKTPARAAAKTAAKRTTTGTTKKAATARKASPVKKAAKAKKTARR